MAAHFSGHTHNSTPLRDIAFRFPYPPIFDGMISDTISLRYFMRRADFRALDISVTDAHF